MSQLPLFERVIKKKLDNKSRQIEDLGALGKVRLSSNFMMRDFLFSSECDAMGISNFPENPEMVIRAGRELCTRLLEPILDHFGRFSITFGYQCREGVEARWSKKKKLENSKSSSPHQWDRGTFGDQVYARVDILPFCIEDGLVSKQEFGYWLMNNLDVDLLMMWKGSNICCMSISPKPRRIWFEWGSPALGQPRRETFMGSHYWQNIYPTLSENKRPKFAPSCSYGCMQWP